MWRIRILIAIVIALFGVGGGVGIVYLIKMIDNQYKNSVQNKFQQLQSEIMIHLNTNITAFNNYLTISSQGINQLYNYGLAANITQYSFQKICEEPSILSKFNLTKVFHAQIIDDDQQLDNFMTSIRKIYNNPDFTPFNNFNGTPTPLPPNFTYPLLLSFVTVGLKST